MGALPHSSATADGIVVTTAGVIDFATQPTTTTATTTTTTATNTITTTTTNTTTTLSPATTVPWLLGLAGLTYGVMSSSWDEEVEGSFLGLDECKTNVGRIFEGINRSGQDRVFREDYEERLRKEANAATMNRDKRRKK